MQTPRDGLSLSRREVLKRFLNRPWFKRAWVYQEAVIAREVEMVWGNLRLPFGFVAGLCKEIKETKSFGPLRSIWYDRQQFHNGEQLDFLYILWRARKYLKATDHRDLVYPFLGFYNSSAQGKILPDYTIPMNDPRYARAVEDTFTTVARVMISNSHSLDIFQVIVPTRHSPDHLPTWVPNWSESRFKSGAPILTPGMPRSFNTCRKLAHTWVDSNPRELHVQGHIVTNIDSMFEHKCGHTYFRQGLLASLQLIEIVTESRNRIEDQYDNLEHATLRTLFADGAFALQQPIEHSLTELLRIYNLYIGRDLLPWEKGDYDLHHYLVETGNMASGKRVFLTKEFDVGLGYSNVKVGDVVCIVYGCEAPCVLRKAKGMADGCYKVIGHCYLDGWMYGDNPRKWKWWKQNPENMILVEE